MTREPIAIIGAIEVAAIALVGVAAAVLEWDEPLTASIIAAVSAVVIAIGTVWQRMSVDSPTTVARKVDEALHREPPA
jgi:drug/metabolite transporter (DMT)-like permease